MLAVAFGEFLASIIEGTESGRALMWAAAAGVAVIIGTAINPSRLEVSSNLNKGLVVAIRPRYWSLRWAIEAFWSNWREGDPTEQGRQSTGRAAHPHPSGVLSLSTGQLGGLVGLPAATDAGSRCRIHRSAPRPGRSHD